jgi:hypothetical protein
MQTVSNLCSRLAVRVRGHVWQSGAVQLQNRIPAVWLVISGIISVQFGAAIAKDCFS